MTTKKKTKSKAQETRCCNAIAMVEGFGGQYKGINRVSRMSFEGPKVTTRPGYVYRKGGVKIWMNFCPFCKESL